MTELPTRHELIDMIEYLKDAMAEMSGSSQRLLPGFTPRESVIIRTLVAANGRVVTRRGLMAAVYHCAANEPDIKIIDIFICKIRKKLRRIFPYEVARLRTERCQGFSWIGPPIEPEGTA